MKNTQRKHKSLFTMMELVIVVAIIALLSALVAPNLLQMFADAEVAAAKTDFGTLKSAATSYYTKYHKVPSVRDLVDKKMLEKAMKDPWGGEYTIEMKDNIFIVSSKGKDGNSPISSADTNE